jgi:hypothetical protein
MRRLLFATLLLAAAPAAVMAAPPAMSADAVRAAVEIVDDPLEPNVLFSTREAQRANWKLFRRAAHDNHLVAAIDRQTGEARFQLRQTVRYWGEAREYHAAHFRDEGGLRTVALSEARPGNDVCPTTENMLECPLTQHMAFDLSEQQVRAIAVHQAQANGAGWSFKMKDRTGRDLVSTITPAEAAGLLLAVDQYRTSART